MTVVQTYSGRKVSLLDPDPAAIDIRDIACGLARLNRFVGATKLPINVADHSLNVVRWLDKVRASPQLQMLGLLHDAHEAYIGDITGPVKRFIQAAAGVNIIEPLANRLDVAIRKACGLPAHVLAADLGQVLVADMTIFAAEWRDLMSGPCPTEFLPANFPIKPRNPDKSEEDFLKAFHRLRMKLGSAVGHQSNSTFN